MTLCSPRLKCLQSALIVVMIYPSLPEHEIRNFFCPVTNSVSALLSLGILSQLWNAFFFFFISAANAYGRTLKKYHGWVVRGVFAVSGKNYLKDAIELNESPKRLQINISSTGFFIVNLQCWIVGCSLISHCSYKINVHLMNDWVGIQ